MTERVKEKETKLQESDSHSLVSHYDGFSLKSKQDGATRKF